MGSSSRYTAYSAGAVIFMRLKVPGKILALGTPSEIKEQARSNDSPAPTIEDAFIHVIQSQEGDKAP